VKSVVGRPTEPVYELVTIDRALLTISRRVEKLGIQLAKPVSCDADASAKHIVIVMKVETADHPFDRSVMGVGVPATSIRPVVDDA